MAGSSPHTRGARHREDRRCFALRIIPAYAGSTIALHMSVGHLPDHPRIRGEHPVLVPSSTQREGSSPHTRGARVDERLQLRRERIIPAYAGSTPYHIIEVPAE